MKISLLILAVLLPAVQCDECEEMSRDEFEEFKLTYTAAYKKLVKTMLSQQMFMDQRIRTDGSSGFKTIRGGKGGPENYFTANHIDRTYNAIHSHADHVGTLGMGESVVVMNGVEFQTRHNDYKAKMPDKSTKKYHAVKNIENPPIPPEVLEKETTQDQVIEMKEWFKAFAKQDYSERDYRKYFKPALCYFEGAWTMNTGKLIEPFVSDRHFVDASTWASLHKKVLYTTYTGMKSRLENLTFLPPGIAGVDKKTGEPIFVQWNYRILCYPSPVDIPTRYLRHVDDMSYRTPIGRSFQKSATTRAARFMISEKDESQFSEWGILDEIFSVIPGVDNNPGNLSEFGEPMYRVDKPGNVPLNTGYYHRWYRFANGGKRITNRTARGFNDEYLFVAQTTNEMIAAVDKEVCTNERINDEVRRVCKNYPTRFTYAIPLEIVYFTPLLDWNPYNITMKPHGHDKFPRGGYTYEKPRQFNTRRACYTIPADFYLGAVENTDPADTAKNFVWTRCGDGEARKVKIPGIGIQTPHIDGIGKLRLRYPIGPVHEEDGAPWKDINALRDREMAVEYRPIKHVKFEMSPSRDEPKHTHDFLMSYADYINLKKHKRAGVKVTTSVAEGHSHKLYIMTKNKNTEFKYTSCDGKKVCPKRHGALVTIAGFVHES